MDEHRKTFVNKIGPEIAKVFKDIYGYVKINVQGGNYVNTNTMDTTKPKQKGEPR